ncbi:SCO7613 C-terminal domain-containing membrane protein, partial [Streptomyces sp. NPDC127110]|uniref:SCO7613 C-terminal domain-containing membrane protein n=1 Tax=Streptomyces sp. NPDC127110 TaxID=3345362 RepID=UPI0036260A7F
LRAPAVRAGWGAGAGEVPGAVRRGLLRAGAAVAAVGALAGLSAVAVALVARAAVLREVWAATAPPQGGPGAGLAAALLLAAGALWLPGGVLPRPVAGAAAVVCGGAALFAAPMTPGLSAWAVFAAQLGVVAAAGVAAVRAPARAVAFAAGGCAAVGALSVSLAALDGRAATFAVFGLLGACCALGAAHRAAAPAVRAGCAVGAVGYAAALVVAAGAVAGLPWSWRAVAVPAVPALVAALAPRLGPVRVAAEAAAASVGVLAVALALAARDVPVLALVLGLAGAVCAGAALRVERRALGWAAGVLFVAAAWVRLAAWGVAVPEAYALPVAVPALAVGLLRRRRDRGASSWSAYGPGLGAALLPSLVAAWGDAYWQRPLLLGTAALALTLAGAHRRLQAPLLLGGAVLAAVALHELAPYVVQVVGVLPRWLPPALAGLLLLVVGATYEKRLRDARRLRAAIGRLR